jgi:hypothetical protein
MVLIITILKKNSWYDKKSVMPSREKPKKIFLPKVSLVQVLVKVSSGEENILSAVRVLD